MERPDPIPLAIIGMACRLPGADSPAEFWQLLRDGRSAITELPSERLEQNLFYDAQPGVRGKTYSKVGGLVNYRPFDPRICPMPSELVASADIAQLTICQVAAEACHDAGMDPFDLPLRRAGVYLGHTLGGRIAADLTYGTCVRETAEWLRELPEFAAAVGPDVDEFLHRLVAGIRRGLPRRGRKGLPNISAHLAALLIAESLGLDGPAQVLDAACASSLQGLALACRALRLGRIDMAVVGGASYLSRDGLILFSQARSVTGGDSRPFDAGADGLVAAEGHVAVIVKTLPRALADGDPVRAVIRGIGVASDGRGKSLWAPRKEGQVQAILRAYGERLDMSRLGFIEAHATSTQAGDSVEMAALTEVLAPRLPAGTKIPVGGVKANIGHTLETAGLAGLLKAVLVLEQGIVPRQIHVERLNPEIDWEHSPCYVPTADVPWPRPADGHPRRAAVNAFGIGGLNVHVVLDEFTGAEPLTGSNSSGAIPSRRATTGAHVAAEEKPLVSSPDAVAVIGMGGILPGARTLDAFWELLASARDPKCEVPADRWQSRLAYEPQARRPGMSATKLGGFITDFEYDWRRHRIPPRQIAGADPLQFMLLDAADAALADAGCDARPLDRARTAVCVGTVFGSDFSAQLQMGLRLPEFRAALAAALAARGIASDCTDAIGEAYAGLLLQRMPALLDETGSFTPSTLASRLTKVFDLMGGGVAINAGHNSSLAALAAAVDLLASGDCDTILCAAGSRAMGLPVFEQLSMAGLVSEHPCSPFSAAADGLVPGEGACVVVLKRLADAQRDGDRIRAIVRGIAAAVADSRGAAIARAIDRALAVSGADAADVAAVELTSAGIPAHDRQEIAATVAAYSAAQRQTPLAADSLTAQFGLMRGTQGMAALVKAGLEFERGEVPPSFALAEPADWMAAHRACLAPPLAAAPLSAGPGGRMLAGITSCDGAEMSLAYHAIIERPVPIPTDTPIQNSSSLSPVCPPIQNPKSKIQNPSPLSPVPCPLSPHILRVAAPDPAALAEKLTAIVNDPSAAFAATPSQFSAADRFRMAMVVRDPADAARKAKLALEHGARAEMQTVLAQQGVFYGQLAAARPRVAFVFSGQGSQYAGMLRPLVAECAAAAESLRQCDEVLLRLGFPSFSALAWDQPEGLGVDPWQTQLSLLVADTVVDAALRSLGIHPDRIAGHSYGEYPALLAAGTWDFATAVRATRVRCDAIESCDASGAMLSSTAPAEVVARLCEELDAHAYVANINAPDQTVAGGEEEAIARLAERLSAAGYRTKRLAVPRPFHTPLMAETQPPFRAALAAITLRPVRVPLLSSVTNEYVADPELVRENLVTQMCQPVRYVDLITRLADEGVGAFVEVGPGTVLTRLNQRILAGRPAVAVAADGGKPAGLEMLLRVQASLEAAGALGPEPLPSRPLPLPSAAPPASAAAPPVDVDAAVVELAGTPYEMGLFHGRRFAEPIRAVLRRYADAADAAEAVLRERRADPDDLEIYFGADELEELAGIAAGAEVPLVCVAAHNLRIYPDGAGCIHFALTAAHNGIPGMLHAANEDLPLGLFLRGKLMHRMVQVRRPRGGHAHVTFSLAGQPAGAAGVNCRGVAVTSATLLDQQPPNGSARGKLHGVIVKRVLEHAADLDAAVEIVRASAGHGAWALCISHHGSDRLAYLEFDGRTLRVRESHTAVLAANHSLLHLPLGEVPLHSRHRLARLTQLLGGDEPCGLEAGRARAALRDRFDLARGRMTPHPTMNTIRRVDNQMSVVFEPAAGAVWIATSSDRADGDEFVRLDVARLLAPPVAAAKQPPPEPPPSAAKKRAETPAISTFTSSPTAQTQPPRLCSRFVLRPVDSPRAAAWVWAPPSASVAVLGQDPVARALVDRVRSAGGRALLIPDVDLTASLAALEAAWAETPVAHLWLTSAFNDAPTGQAGLADRERGVLLPFFLTQRWFKLVVAAGLLERAALVATTRLGGDFGLSGRVVSIESGAIAGLVRALGLESLAIAGKPLQTKIVDFAERAAPEQVADAVLSELADSAAAREVGYFSDRRSTITAAWQPLAAAAGRDLVPGGPWIITGGARGITAVVARELGKRFGLRLHLVGSSPLPQIDPAWRDLSPEGLRELRTQVVREGAARGEVPVRAWQRVAKALEIDRNLRAFDEAGLRVTYHAVDVTDPRSLAAMLDTVRAADGPVEGVIHGAGIESACRFEKKQRDVVERTVAVKLDGAAALLDLTRGDPLRYFVAFGSISGRLGGVGQADYCAANAMLAALVDRAGCARSDCRFATFHWHGWDEVGMAARPETKSSPVLKSLRFMPPAEGVEHLIDELRAGLPEREVVITEWDYCRKFFPALPAAPTPVAPPAAAIDPVAPARPPVVTQPAVPAALLGAILDERPRERLVVEFPLDPVHDIFLREHRLKGRPTLPIVVGLEAFAQAASLLAKPQTVAGFVGVVMPDAVRFLRDEPLRARIIAERTEHGIACRLVSDLVNRAGQLVERDREHFLGTVLVTERPEPIECVRPWITQTWFDVAYPDVNPVIYHGPPFRCLRQTFVDEGGGWGRMFAPDPCELFAERAGEKAVVPSALLDACLFTCGICVWVQNHDLVPIPHALARLRLARAPRPGEECIGRFLRRRGFNDRAAFDFVVFGDDDEPLLAVDGYEGALLRGPALAVPPAAGDAVT